MCLDAMDRQHRRLSRFERDGTPGAAAMLDAMRRAAKGYGDPVGKACRLGEAADPRSDPAGMPIGELGRRGDAAAQWHGQDDSPLGRADPQRVATRIGEASHGNSEAFPAVTDDEAGCLRRRKAAAREGHGSG